MNTCMTWLQLSPGEFLPFYHLLNRPSSQALFLLSELLEQHSVSMHVRIPHSWPGTTFLSTSPTTMTLSSVVHQTLIPHGFLRLQAFQKVMSVPRLKTRGYRTRWETTLSLTPTTMTIMHLPQYPVLVHTGDQPQILRTSTSMLHSLV